MKLPHTEVKFYPEVKSEAGLSSLRLSCKRALRETVSKKRTDFLTRFLPEGVKLNYIYFNSFMTEAVNI